MRIALIKFGALGDVVRTTCLLRPLRRRYPDSRIDWYTLPSARPLLERNPSIHSIVDTGQPDSAVYDLVIGLDEDRDACRLAGRLTAKERFGAYEDDKGRLTFTESSRAWFQMGLLNRDPDGSLKTANRLKQANRQTYPSLLFGMLGLKPQGHDGEPMIVPDPAARRWAADFAVRQGLFKSDSPIGINTGAGQRWPTKQLSVDKTLSLIQAVRSVSQAPLFLFGGPDETERNREILRRSPTPLIDTGTMNPLERFISLIHLCGTLITSDSLAMHLAAALGINTIVFFGPTSADEIELYGRGTKWLPSQACACYYQPACTAAQFCLDALDPQAILPALRGVLAK